MEQKKRKKIINPTVLTTIVTVMACLITFVLGFVAGHFTTENGTKEAVTTKSTQTESLSVENVTAHTTEEESAQPTPDDDEFVKITDYIPTIRQELAYATPNNFTNKVVYDFKDAYIRYGTLKKLEAVQNDLAEHGVGLVIWDAFRPVSGQQALWDAYPDPNYVASPDSGGPHCRGNTVDVTLCDLKTGKKLEMPTKFDEFSEKANTDFSDDTPEARKNAELLYNTMKENGFEPYSQEWWHYQDSDYYDVEKEFDPAKIP